MIMSEIKNTNHRKNIEDRSQKLKDPEKIFDEVNENTTNLLIGTISPKNFYIVRDFHHFHPNAPIINLYDYPKGCLTDLKTLPIKLDNLKTFEIRDTEIKNLFYFPKNLLSLKFLRLENSPINKLKGLPQNLPSLESIMIRNCPIHTLEYIPSSLPRLKKFSISGCPLHNLRKFPKNVPNLEELNLGGNQIASLEGLPPELAKIKKIKLIGNNLTSLKYFPLKIDSIVRIEFDHNPLRSLCYLNNDLISKVMFRHKIFKQYKGFDLGPRFEQFLTQYLVPYERVNEDTGEMEIGQMYHPQVIEQIQNYYRKTTTELIQQYISNSESISEDELERIIWEANIEDRNALESNFPSDNVALQKINHRLKFDLSSGGSIFK